MLRGLRVGRRRQGVVRGEVALGTADYGDWRSALGTKGSCHLSYGRAAATESMGN